MNNLTYKERISVMRILQDIILADGKVDNREQMLFEDIMNMLGLERVDKQNIERQNSLIALTIIYDFAPEQKEAFAKLMGKMIIIDENINYNEVKIYNVVNEFCHINVEFSMNNYPEYSHGSLF